jgi:Notch-like protein
MTQYLNIKCNPTLPKEIDKIIKSIRSKNAYGCDEISTKLLKISSPFISSPFNYICNKTLSTGVFHDQLKFSEIKPLYKKCNKNNASNNQPISLLTSFSKVFEK